MHMCAYIPGQTKKEFKDTLPKVKTSLTLKFRLCASVCFLVFFFACLSVLKINASIFGFSAKGYYYFKVLKMGICY